MSEYIAKASIEPRDYRVVFLSKKRRPEYRTALSYATVQFDSLFKINQLI